MTNFEDKDLEEVEIPGISAPPIGPGRMVPRFDWAGEDLTELQAALVEAHMESIEEDAPLPTTRDPKSGYYDAGGIETLDIIRAKLTPEQFEGYQLGCAIKYLCRYNFKNNKKRDAEKASNYSKWLSEEAK
jgi:hypothetical protein